MFHDAVRNTLLMTEDRRSCETCQPRILQNHLQNLISLIEIGRINAFGSGEQRSLGRRTDVTAN